ncbi:MAG: hypothetical protein ACXW4P_23520, partial [Thermoanaerobaculia bacterium]
RLRSRLSGYYNYHGITCNFEALDQLYRETLKSWQYWLNRRSQRGRMPWKRFLELLQAYPLPLPRIVHSWV